MTLGHPYHTTRFDDGTWTASFDAVEEHVKNGPGALRDISCAPFLDDMHVVGLGGDGHLYHAAWRAVTASWEPKFDKVTSNSGKIDTPGPILDVSCGGAGDFLHVVGSMDGNLVYTNRDGRWLPDYEPVKEFERNDDRIFSDVACTGVGSDLHIVGVTYFGDQLLHTIRHSDGTWQPELGLIPPQDPNKPGEFRIVDVAEVSAHLHVVGIINGQLWHTIRNPDGSWQAEFGLIESQESNNPGHFSYVACAGIGDRLHVVGAVGGKLWHTIRNADGSWQQEFGLVPGQAQDNPGWFIDVSCAGIGTELHIVGITAF